MMQTPETHPLSESELAQLRVFIARKGFGEPALVLEILDHFACKVEEVGNQHPDWPLEKRMIEAHRQFGVAGFYPLVKSYEEQLQRHCSRYFRKSLVRVLTNARSLGLVVLAPLWVYALTFFLAPAWQRFTGWEPHLLMAGLAFLLFAAIDFCYIRPFRKEKNVFVRAVQTNGWGSLFLPGLYFVVVPLEAAVPLPILVGLTVLFAGWERARYATFRQAWCDSSQKLNHFKGIVT